MNYLPTLEDLKANLKSNFIKILQAVSFIKLKLIFGISTKIMFKRIRVWCGFDLNRYFEYYVCLGDSTVFCGEYYSIILYKRRNSIKRDRFIHKQKYYIDVNTKSQLLFLNKNNHNI